MFYRHQKKLANGVQLIRTYSPTIFYGVGYHLGYGYRTVYCILGHRELSLQLNGGKSLPSRGYKENLDDYFTD